jgi:pimeloyl-ACP methyl ester carboxylesterase
MSARLIVASLAGALLTALPSHSASAVQTERSAAARESRIQVGKASLYTRDIGRGQPNQVAQLRQLSMPTLVISGAHDFIPAEIAAHIARSMPNARLVTIKNCGHFAYLECAGDVRRAFNDFFRSTPASGRPH